MVRWAMVRVMMVVMRVVMVVMVIRISPAPIVWVIPIVVPAIAVWATPIVERIIPAIVPAIGRHSHCTPRAEHRGYILWLNPNHIARDHHIIECRIIGRSVEEGIRVAQRVVGRWHTIGWRREAIQATSIGTLVRIGQDCIVGVEVLAARDCNALLRRLGLNLGQGSLILSLLRLVLRLGEFRLGLLTLGNGNLVVYGVQVVRIGDILPRSGTSREEQNLHGKKGKYYNLSHNDRV